MAEQETALIVGAGRGLSASLARLFAKEGMKVALAARNTGKLVGLAADTGAGRPCLRRRRSGVDRSIVRRRHRQFRRPQYSRLQRQQPGRARPDNRTRPGRGPQRAYD